LRVCVWSSCHSWMKTGLTYRRPCSEYVMLRLAIVSIWKISHVRLTSQGSGGRLKIKESSPWIKKHIFTSLKIQGIHIDW
jgi:hypothetical protein